MASTAHGVLSPNQIQTVYVDPGINGVVIVNRNLEGAIWVTIDGSDPRPAMPGTYVVLGARDFNVTRAQVRSGNLAVKLISDAARAYTVEAIA